MCDHSENDEQELAVVLHRKLCRYNHVDCCSWYYESKDTWTNVYNRAHQEYLQKARTMLTISDLQTIVKLIAHL